MFDTLGYDTLQVYWDNTSTGINARECFSTYGVSLVRNLSEVLSAAEAAGKFEPHGDTLAIFGHAVFLNAVALALVVALQPANEAACVEAIMQFRLGEAEGLLMKSDRGGHWHISHKHTQGLLSLVSAVNDASVAGAVGEGAMQLQ
jgi:hypothetical protein